jgi:hypothetical protein
MNKEERTALEEWTRQLTSALGLTGLELDLDDVLDLAGIAARSIVRPAAPVTTFLAGFAAGRSAGSGTAPEEAVAEAISAAAGLAGAE